MIMGKKKAEEVKPAEKMKVEMSYDALSKIVKSAFNAGILQYRTMIRPESDKVKQCEARRYLKNLGYEPKLLDELVELKRIHRRKDGDEKSNCSVYYSLREIQRQLTVIEMKKGYSTQVYP